MAFTLIQGDSKLQLMDGAGTVIPLTLPTGVTISAAAKPRFAVYQRYAIMANSCSRSLTVDSTGTVRVLSLRPPTTAVTLAGGSGASLTGSYSVKQTYVVRDTNGNIISESDFGPPSTYASIANQSLLVTGINLSNDAITGTRLYRTTSNGSVYFPWIELSGNTQTTTTDGTADASLSIFAAPILGSAPDSTIMVEYQGRLWGVDRQVIDTVRYTEAGLMYSWPQNDSIPMPKPGSSDFGVTGLVPRREALGLARQNMFCQLTGSGTADFALLILSETVGVMSQESVVTWQDTSYFLSQDGVYAWDSTGLNCVSDGHVRSWFNTDTYFNRSQYGQAFAQFDPVRLKYRLFLCSAGSTTIDRWVEYDVRSQAWWGPHQTAAFNPTCAFLIRNSQSIQNPTIGSSSGYLWQEQSAPTDGTSGISWIVATKLHDVNLPNEEKVWLRPIIVQLAQPSGTITVSGYAGDLPNTPSGVAVTPTLVQLAALTKSHQALARLGKGKVAGFVFSDSTIGEKCVLLGYEIPWVNVGLRL